jgi:hypothetical protein
MPADRKKLFGVWFAMFLFATVGLGATTGFAANGNSNSSPGHTPNANPGGTQQGQQYPTPHGGRGIPGCGPSDSQPKKCHDAQTPTTPQTPSTPSTPSAPSAPGTTNAPAATTPQQGVLGTRTTTGAPSGSNGPASGGGNAGTNATAQPAAAIKRQAPFTG